MFGKRSELRGRRCSSGLARFAVLATVLLSATLSISGIFLSAIEGTAVDEVGKPLSGIWLSFTDPKNGRHFTAKTDTTGRFVYIAVEPSVYTLSVERERKKPVVFENVSIPWSSAPQVMTIDLQKGLVKVSRQIVVPESFSGDSQPIAVPAPVVREDTVAKAINEHLAFGRELSQQGKWDEAIREFQAATDIDSSRDLPWALMAQAYCEEAAQAANRDALLQRCVANYKNAIALSPQAAYLNNLGAAYVQRAQYGDAAAQFRDAERLTPEHALLYEQNLGVALLKQAETQNNAESIGLMQQAVTAFDRVLAGDAKRADVYYWKGMCLLRLAAAETPGTSYQSAANAFDRYAELAPQGHFIAEVRTLRQGLKEMSEAKN